MAVDCLLPRLRPLRRNSRENWCFAGHQTGPAEGHLMHKFDRGPLVRHSRGAAAAAL